MASGTLQQALRPVVWGRHDMPPCPTTVDFYKYFPDPDGTTYSM